MVPLKAVALPAAAWTAFCLVWLLAAMFDVPSAFDGRTMTLPEAAAVASHADAARLLDAGADPNARGHVRAHLVRNDEETLTPLEAATAAIRTGPVQMLVDRGARIDDSNFRILWCAAKARNNQDLLGFLRAHHGSARIDVDCTRVHSVW